MNGKINKMENKIDYAFLETVIHKLYYPYYYLLIKIDGDSYIK
jgi:hypothetical protein